MGSTDQTIQIMASTLKAMPKKAKVALHASLRELQGSRSRVKPFMVTWDLKEEEEEFNMGKNAYLSSTIQIFKFTRN